ncbi:MAG: EAL domain-containing protein [Microthrixaceae bacterium]|nr:EAL domain-containing protein [Microthrixaceae bacterium]
MPPNAWVEKAMAELATRLRIEVIAEGVTSGHQVSMLAKLGVPAAQGYLLGLPGPMDRIPGAVNIRALLHSSLNGIENHGGVGPLVQMSGNRAVVASAREHVARSEVGDRRRESR